jgi:hypothetical protein
MINECTADTTVLATARREATRVWSRAGVSLRWVAAIELPYGSPKSDWLVVRCISGWPAEARRASHDVPIAAIRFIDGQPTNTIVVSVGNANVLLARDTRESRILGERFRSLKELWLGRVMGRAIAHEIGHFVQQSGAHTETGLMKATHSISDFIGSSVSPFSIDGLEWARLDNDVQVRASR